MFETKKLVLLYAGWLEALAFEVRNYAGTKNWVSVLTPLWSTFLLRLSLAMVVSF